MHLMHLFLLRILSNTKLKHLGKITKFPEPPINKRQEKMCTFPKKSIVLENFPIQQRHLAKWEYNPTERSDKTNFSWLGVRQNQPFSTPLAAVSPKDAGISMKNLQSRSEPTVATVLSKWAPGVKERKLSKSLLKDDTAPRPIRERASSSSWQGSRP